MKKVTIFVIVIALFLGNFSNFGIANLDEPNILLENISSVMVENEFENTVVYNVQYTASFSEDDLVFDKLMEYDIVKMKDCSYLKEIGKPMIPTKEIMIALPDGIAAKKVRVVGTQSVNIKGEYTIFPSQSPQPIDISIDETAFIPPDSQIYDYNKPYPSNLVELTGQTDLAGQGMATITIYPIHYIPRKKSLTLITSIKFTIDGVEGYVCGDYLPKDISENGRKMYENMVKEMVINPDDVELQVSNEVPQRLGIDSGDYDYVIITTNSWISAFQPLADWKTKKGVPANIVTTDWIYNSGNYSGSNKEKIRTFIQDAHANWGTTFFLLGGDTNYIPYHTANYLGDNIPTDTYYSDYDDDWVCEVHVGRASVDQTGNSAGGIGNFVSKTLTYEKNPPVSNYAKKIALFGFDLNSVTDGEDCKIDINSLYIPSGWSVTTVYDSHSGNHEDAVDTAVNNGQNLINHIDHSNEYFMGTGSYNHDRGLTTSEVDAFSNGNKQSTWYSIGCWACAYDYSNCIAEHFVRDTNGGGVAFVGNSRYGWYQVGYDDYASLRYDRYFFRSFFNQNHYKLGDLFSDHKMDAYNSMTPDNYNKYIFTELTLLGDPEMPIWTENPSNLVVSHLYTLPIAPSLFTVHVETTSGSNVNNAFVCLWKGDEIYELGYTSSTGDVTFTISPFTLGTMYVTVTKHNYIPSESVAQVTDNYEPDDIYTESNWIETDNTKQFHNFHIPGDYDWVKFNATSQYTYAIETSDLGLDSDTILYLYDTNGTTLIDWDDDGGSGLSSCIEWICPINGIYYVMVEHWDNSASGPETHYNLSILIENFPPNANFNVEPSSPTTQDIIYFNDTSFDSDGNIINWTWDFGEGNTSNLQNPIHQYADDGIYTVTLNVTDDDGATNETSQQISILNVGPIANFTYSPANPTTNDTIQFTAMPTDPDGYIASWTWDFGDGNTSTEPNPTHLYADNGTYTVTLNVTDDDEAKNETSQQITVSNVKPIAGFTYSPQNPTDLQTVTFTDISSDLDGYIIFWFWNLGDGNTSTEPNPTHLHADNGIYTVTLNVTDNDGATNETSQQISILNVGPIANFTYSPLNPTTGYTIQFTDLSADSDGILTNWTWEFGDGNISYLQNPTHQYSDNGTYTVTLNVSDDDGATDEKTTFIILTEDTEPPSNVTGLVVNDEKDGKLGLSWNSASDDVGVVYYRICCDKKPTINTTDNATYYRYTGLSNGITYTFNVSAVDAAGNEGEQSNSISGTPTASGGGNRGSSYVPLPPALNQPPIANLSAGEPYTGFIGEEITFDASLSLDNDGTIILYEWDFDGDGTYDYNSTEHTTTYVYNVKGEYTVILQVTDDEGDVDNDETIVIISQPNRIPSAPDVDGPQEGTQNTEYTYTAVSIDGDNDTIQYHFDWSDGNANTTEFLPNGTATTQMHIWTAAGKYTITVQAYDNQTPSDTTRYTVLIDAHIVEDIGYITDDDANGTYDTFHGENIEIELGQEDGSYLIDYDGDGEWDYSFALTTGLTIYQKEDGGTPGFEILIALCAMALILFWKRKMKK